MKKLVKYLIEIVILVAIISMRDKIYDFFIDRYFEKYEVSLEYKNRYYLSYNYDTVKNVDNFSINNKNDLTNLFYTVLNKGYKEFDFYCPKEYVNCVDDVIELTGNQVILSGINGFVHPFNSFDTIDTTYDSIGRIHLNVVNLYTNAEIELLNNKVYSIITEQLKEVNDTKEMIKIIHDYIIENTKYDKDRADYNIIKYPSNTAYGVLFDGYGICSGYTDAMALFLDYYNIPNFELSSDNHVWNVVKLDGKWYHLDLTWDDPIITNGDEIVSHEFFLISTEELLKLDRTEHDFDTNFYKELN